MTVKVAFACSIVGQLVECKAELSHQVDGSCVLNWKFKIERNDWIWSWNRWRKWALKPFEMCLISCVFHTCFYCNDTFSDVLKIDSRRTQMVSINSNSAQPFCINFNYKLALRLVLSSELNWLTNSVSNKVFKRNGATPSRRRPFYNDLLPLAKPRPKKKKKKTKTKKKKKKNKNKTKKKETKTKTKEFEISLSACCGQR